MNDTPHAFDVCVLGSFMKDLVAQAPRRPQPGETLRGSGFREFLGGKGVNQAVAAARAGARTAMIGRLGTDRHGDEFAEMLAAEKIDTSQVQRDPTAGTGVGLPVVEPGGGNSIIIVPRANDAVSPADIDAAATLISSSKVLLVQLELPFETVLAALHTARSHGVTTILNPAPYLPLPADIAEFVDVIIPNEVEAEQLTGLRCDDDKAEQIARLLADSLARQAAVVTLGSRGAVLASGGATSFIAPYAVEAVDSTGAGDAFCGALAARLAAGDSLWQAATFASAAGALATTKHGAVPAMPYAHEIRRA
ncbi:ribokinase [Catelliglobosispora koreensis]|uniref:ribokinase n=1 Tax=Catelliglobosispora koreensis TaxID=129052 RepID=UPI0003607CC9|nr:ribokinase [Catelliglobosispora koreensis]